MPNNISGIGSWPRNICGLELFWGPKYFWWPKMVPKFRCPNWVPKRGPRECAQNRCPKFFQSVPQICAPNFSNFCPKFVPQICAPNQIFPICAPNLCPKTDLGHKFGAEIGKIWGTDLGQKLEKFGAQIWGTNLGAFWATIWGTYLGRKFGAEPPRKN